MARSTLVTGITAAGQLVAADAPGPLVIQNVGTVVLGIYYTSDGSGDPVAWLTGGTANDDGTGALFSDDRRNAPVWLKAPAGGGRALVRA